MGLAFIKKCAGFDRNVPCYGPAYENQGFVKAIQEIHDLRHRCGLAKEKAWIKYVPFADALREADFVRVHVPLLRANESKTRPIIFSTSGDVTKMPYVANKEAFAVQK